MPMTQAMIVFDTHEAIHQLTAAGVPERQAEAHVRLQAQLIEQNFATKTDMESLGRTTKADIESFRLATKADFKALSLSNQALAAELRTDMATLKTAVADKLTDHFRWLIGMQVGVAAILLAAIKLF